MKTGFVTLLMIGIAMGQSGGIITRMPDLQMEPYWWAAMNADGTEAVRCTYGQNGFPGECKDKTHSAPFPVSCDAPKDGYFTNCRIVDVGVVSIGYSGGDETGTQSIGIPSPKPAKSPAGQFDAATFKGPWPTNKVDCIDLGNNYFNVHYQDGTELHFADSRPNRDVPPIPDPMPPDVDNADLCSELHADKLKADKNIKPHSGVNTFYDNCTGKKCDDVPAIRKTRSGEIGPVGFERSKEECVSKGDFWYCANYCVRHEDYLDCPEPDAYSLQISVSGKNARCVRIVP